LKNYQKAKKDTIWYLFKKIGIFFRDSALLTANNPYRIMKLRPVRVPEGISFVDGEVVKKDPATEDVQLYFAF